MDLTRLLAPAQIAVVGATERHGSYGAQTLINLDALGFPGPVWGVNPRYEEVLGRPCVGSLADLPGPVDAVVIAIPAAGVAEIVEQAGALGCGGAVVYGAGFAEVASGRAEQEALIAAARRHSLPVCGPNGSGIVAMASRAAMWGDALPVREPGHVALVSQSGNVAVNALAAMRGLRFHTVVSSGNQAVLRASDYLDRAGRGRGRARDRALPRGRRRRRGAVRRARGLRGRGHAGRRAQGRRLGRRRGSRGRAHRRARGRPARLPRARRGGGRGLGATTSTTCSSWRRRSP